MAGGFGGYFDFLLLNNSPDKESAAETASNSPQEPNAKEHVCGVCGKAFERQGRLTQHQRVHSNIRPFACTECGVAFKRTDHLRTHMERFHSSRRYKSVCCGKIWTCFKNMRDWHVKNPQKCSGAPSNRASVASKDKEPKLNSSPASREMTKRRHTSPLVVSQRKQRSNTTAPHGIPEDLRQRGEPFGNSQRPKLSIKFRRRSTGLNGGYWFATADCFDGSERQRQLKPNTTTPRWNMHVNRQRDKHVVNSRRPTLSRSPLRKSPRLNPGHSFTSTGGSNNAVVDSSGQEGKMQNWELLPSPSSSTSDESLYLDLSDDQNNSDSLTVAKDRLLSGPSSENLTIKEAANGVEPDYCGGADATSTTSTDASEVVGTPEEIPALRRSTLCKNDVFYFAEPCAPESPDSSIADSSVQPKTQEMSMYVDISDDDDGSDAYAIAMERRLTWSMNEDPTEETTNAAVSEGRYISFEADAFYRLSEVVGTLEQILPSESSTLSEDGVGYVVKPCVSKLSVLHENGYMSGLMTAENILVYRNASVDPDPCGYSARECEDPETANYDVVALGQLMLKLLPDDHSGLSPGCMDFIICCLAPASAAELLVHPFLENAERGRVDFQFQVDTFALKKTLMEASDS